MASNTEAKVYKLIRYAVAEWNTPNMAGGYSHDGAKLLKEIGCEWGWKGTIFTFPTTHQQHALLNRALEAVDMELLNRSQLGIVSNRKFTLKHISKGNYFLFDARVGGFLSDRAVKLCRSRRRYKARTAKQSLNR